MDLTLGEIAEVLATAVDTSAAGRTVSTVTADSRQVEAEALFVAFEGEHADGNRFVKDAADRGCAAALVSRDQWQADTQGPCVLFRVDDTVGALQEIAAFYRKKIGYRIVGITGSNGKTTTKEMTAAVLSSRYSVEKTAGNLNNHIGLPLSLLSWGIESDCGVLELGANHVGEIARLSEIARPDLGVITNIGRGHMGYFGSRENILAAKMELVHALPRSGTAFINGDDPMLKKAGISGIQTITYGFSEYCDIRGIRLPDDERGYAKMDVQGIEIVLNMPGIHNLYNALAAVSVGIVMDVPVEQAKDALFSFVPVDKRSEILYIDPFIVIDDSYNANPDSMEAAFSSASSVLSGRRKIAVLGDMFELGRFSRKEHSMLGEQLGRYGFSALFCTGTEMAYTAESAESAGVGHVEHFPAREDLIDALEIFCRPGDGILVKGSRGMGMESVVSSIKQWAGQNNGE